LSARRFPPPWTIEETDACFFVKISGCVSLADVYFEDARGEAVVTPRGA
jgi:hypothetical protein